MGHPNKETVQNLVGRREYIIFLIIKKVDFNATLLLHGIAPRNTSVAAQHNIYV